MNKIYLAVLFSIIIFISVNIYFSIEDANLIFDSFNKFSIGLAGLVTAYFGSSYFFDEVIRKRRIKDYQKKFPYNDYEKNWEIVVREDRDGEPHVLNKKTNEIHHLWNMKTIYDLGWQFYERKPIKNGKWTLFKRGDYIRTRGDLGE